MIQLLKQTRFSKATILPMVLAALVVISLNITAVEFYRLTSQKNLKTNTQDQAEIIKAAIYQPFWNMDSKSMITIIDSVLAQQAGSVAAIKVIEFDSSTTSSTTSSTIIVFRVGSKWLPKTFNELISDEDFVLVEKPMIYKGEKLGSIQVVLSIADAKREINQISFLIVLVTLIVSALCGALVLTFYLRRLNQRLQTEVDERTRELDIQRMAVVNSARLLALGEMSAGIAHEINNPLTVIEGKTFVLNRLLKNSPEFELAEKNIKKISEMVMRISKIIVGLRTFSRDGSHEAMADIAVPKFFEAISDLCQCNLSHKSILIDFIIQNRDLHLFGKEIQLSQVLINMINNSADAIQHLPKKWIKVECFTRGNDIVFAVTDSGSGIPVDVQVKMMQPFFTTKEIGKGTGLGLSISLGIVESHGGKLVYCPNSPNTRFEIILKAPARKMLDLAV